MKNSKRVLLVGAVLSSRTVFCGWIESVSPSEMKNLVSDLEKRFDCKDSQSFLEKASKKWPKPANETIPTAPIIKKGMIRPKGMKGQRR